MFSLKDIEICVKITICFKYSNSPYKTLYFNLIPYFFYERYSWFFRYLTARIQVVHPKRRVYLRCYQVTPELKYWFSEKYLQDKRKNIERSLRAKVTELNRKIESCADDLFGYGKQDLVEKRDKYQYRLDNIANEDLSRYKYDTYVNNTKEWMKGEPEL